MIASPLSIKSFCVFAHDVWYGIAVALVLHSSRVYGLIHADLRKEQEKEK